MQLRRIAEDLKRHRAELTLLGTGTPELAAGFADVTETSYRLLVDPQLVGYKAFELGRKLYGGLRPQTPLRYLRALARGFRSGGVQGDPHQLGGVFIISPRNELMFSYYSRTLDDRIRPELISSAIAQAEAAA